MKTPFFRTIAFIAFAAFSTLGCEGQVLHSSIDPTVHWDSLIRTHSSINPTQWVSDDTLEERAHREQANLKKPVIPYNTWEEMMKYAMPFQTGKATFYSAKMHGRKMADGTRYDKNELFAAHRTLPFGTMVRVVNQKNGKEVTVRIADRGPYGKGLIIDLSNKAAAEIDMMSHGVVPVELYIVGKKE